jgi:hypothetical protein
VAAPYGYDVRLGGVVYVARAAVRAMWRALAVGTAMLAVFAMAASVARPWTAVLRARLPSVPALLPVVGALDVVVCDDDGARPLGQCLPHRARRSSQRGSACRGFHAAIDLGDAKYASTCVGLLF